MAYYGFEPEITEYMYVRVGGYGNMDGTSPENAAPYPQSLYRRITSLQYTSYVTNTLTHAIIYIGGGNYCEYNPDVHLNNYGITGYISLPNIHTTDFFLMVSFIGDIYGEYTGDPGAVQLAYYQYNNSSTLAEIKNVTFVSHRPDAFYIGNCSQVYSGPIRIIDYGLNTPGKYIIDGCVFKDTIVESPDYYTLDHYHEGDAIEIPYIKRNDGTATYEIIIKNCLFDRRGRTIDYLTSTNIHGKILINAVPPGTHVSLMNNTFYLGSEKERKYGCITRVRGLYYQDTVDTTGELSLAMYNNLYVDGYNQTVLVNMGDSREAASPYGDYIAFDTISADYNYYDLWIAENDTSDFNYSVLYYYPYYEGREYLWPTGWIPGRWNLWAQLYDGTYFYPTLAHARMSGQELHSIGNPAYEFEGDAAALDGPGLEEGSKFKLTADSACVDAGLDVGITEDILKNPRPSGITTDIGCYERSSYPIVSVSGGSYASITRSRFQYKGGDPSSDTKRAALIGNVSQYFFAMNIANVKHELPVAYDDMNSFWNIIAEFKILS